jgi:hypothetical protein
MKKCFASIWIYGVMIVALTVTASAQLGTCPIVNGGFESGDFTGWSVVPGGGASVIGDYQDRNYLPAIFEVSPFGSFQAKLTPASATAASIETFLNVTPGFFTGQKMTNGAAIKQSFAGNAGDVISCSFYWSGQDVAGASGSSFNDTAYLTITQSGTTSPAVFTLADIVSNGNGHDYSVSFFNSHPGKGQGSSSYVIGSGLYEKGYKTFAWTLPITQTYTIGLVSFNQTDSNLPSDLLVDNCVCSGNMPPSGPPVPR